MRILYRNCDNDHGAHRNRPSLEPLHPHLPRGLLPRQVTDHGYIPLSHQQRYQVFLQTKCGMSLRIPP